VSILTKNKLEILYLDKKLSSNEIANELNISERRINYWIKKYNIPKRSISEAIYLKYNPNGDPFEFNKPKNLNDAFLFGLGVGLYWGEGTKSNKHSVRLGNTDPDLIKKFIEFMEKIYNADRKKFQFGLQVFSDMNPQSALNFWAKELNVNHKKFYKVIVTPARSLGTYKNKTKHGVLTINFNNKKLRDAICKDVEKLRRM